MKKLTLGAAVIALSLGLATAATTASAKDRYPQMAAAADMNKDGMVSRTSSCKPWPRCTTRRWSR